MPPLASTRSVTRTPRRVRPWLALLLAAAVVLVSGCGATIDTVLTIDKSGKGTRAMTLTVAKDDVKEHAKGGMKAIEASIKKHLPAELKYGGQSTTGDNHVAKFTLEFDSLDDYKAKVAKLSSLGSGRPFTPEIELEAPDSVFRSGVKLRENFSSEQLMAWLPNALTADGVVPDDSSDMFDVGTSTVVYGGAKITSPHPIRVDSITDHGISSATMTTYVLPDGTFRRSIVASLNAKSYGENAKAFDKYFADNKPEGAEVAKGEGQDGTATWTITFTAADADALAAGTGAVFGKGSARFEINQKVVADGGVRLEREIIDAVDCSAICAETAKDVTDVIVVDKGWEPAGRVSEASENVDLTGDQVAFQVTTSSSESAKLRRPLPVESAEVSTEIGRDQSVHQKIVVTVATANAELAGDALPAMLTPEKDFGSLDTDSGDETTTYTISLSADNAGAFSVALENYLPGSLVSIAQNAEDGFFRSNYLVAVQTSLDAFGYAGPIKEELSTPSMHTAELGASSGGTVSWTSEPDQENPTVIMVSGWTIPGIIVMSVVGLLVLAGAAVVALVVRRNLATNRTPPNA